MENACLVKVVECPFLHFFFFLSARVRRSHRNEVKIAPWCEKRLGDFPRGNM